ncbi:sodium- and chloride-dependent neutral and basic amino acid transporter B(0+) isoform X2 [Lingula anatina]|uniref:Transporter n=1 Tax=Lingula anatina TaxID=7574 RepID=A0A1S3HXE5_LINAN|nr:sodium- and chloride-dependent neutral and basic amino acid transporter B(0+) isoform X2 [Lingula anatina]|eukprot:XP_013390683.1 sodium- and chloride-dependent neutral and basic amino acid transporter B(0+) isoform X2 [Lingula anatina]
MSEKNILALSFKPLGDTPKVYTDPVMIEPNSSNRWDVDTESTDGDENKKRGNWSNQFDFILSCLGYAVGLGNLWRFPFLCFKNGGAVFLIPYAICLLLIGMPIFVLELYLGQFSSSGPLTVWRFSPMFTGVGIGMMVASSLVGIYYNIVMAWALYYLFASFTSKLPWQDCGDWSSDTCITKLPDISGCNTTLQEVAYPNGTCYNANGTLLGVYNDTLLKQYNITRSSAAEEYFFNTVLQVGSGLETFSDLTGISWQLSLCLLLAWIIDFFCLFRSVKSSGKVVYFTAIFPYVVLIILLIRGALLSGSLNGVEWYIAKADLSKLRTPEVWLDAITQIFFSLSASFGGLHALSSYNKFHNNCLRDAIIVSLGNCLTSFFAGFVVFSYVGYMAELQGVDIDEVAKGGPSLAFVIWPSAVATIPVSPLWSILLFFMLITLGLDSQFTLLETIFTGLLDAYPKIRKHKVWVHLAVCLVLFGLGLPMCTKGGLYLLDYVDSAINGWPMVILGLTELIAVAWVYGAYPRYKVIFLRAIEDMKVMLGDSLLLKITAPWWTLCWILIAPVLLGVVTVVSWILYKPNPSYFGEVLQWLVRFAIVGPIIIYPVLYGIYCLIVRPKDKTFIRPQRDWGPSLVKHRRLVTYDPNFVTDPYHEEMGLTTRNGKETPSGNVNVGYVY